MTLLRFRITGSQEAQRQVLERLADIEGVQRADEVADLLPHMDDEDSSSAGLAENEHAQIGEIVVELDSDEVAGLVRRLAEVEAREAGAALEIIDPE